MLFRFFYLYPLILKNFEIFILVFLTFIEVAMIMTKKFLIVNPVLDTFDDFVDDLISSDANLLKGELDFLLIQHLFNSIDLKLLNKIESEDNESLAA